ncbi:MAG: tyrosine-type recombinase/integrase [Planctomycetota bacterium]|jgi:site-specific recombinase XerD
MHVTWDLWIDLYCETWCVARNLRTSTIGAYRDSLRQFRQWVQREHLLAEPTRITSRIVLEYVVYLREKRNNGDSAVGRAIVVLKNLYAAMVSFGHLPPRDNPMAGFPRMRKTHEKLPTYLSSDELRRLLASPKTDTVLGLRDRAILMLLYATGIRANECATALEEWVDLDERTIRVFGKGGRERVIPLNERAVEALRTYRQARGHLSPGERFFRTKDGRGIGRKIVYQRVKKYALVAKISKRVSPHTLRHTCATHLVQRGENVVTIRDILGHRQLTSTQVYIHTTAHELREVARNHPIGELAPRIASLIEGVRIPIDYPPRRRAARVPSVAKRPRSASRASPPARSGVA